MTRKAFRAPVGRLRSLSASDWLRVGIIVCAVVAVGLAVLARAQSPASSSANTPTTLLGHSAPTFSLPAAQNGEVFDQSVGFAGSTGRPTLLVFFDTLCVHCLADVQAAHAAGQAVGGAAMNIIYLDSPGENAQITQQYMARLQFDEPVLLDVGGHVAQRYHVSYYPSLILVDRHGVVRFAWVGAATTSDIHAAVSRLG